ncbi:Hypothetical_protein [Hexamita inflata]|uniref:Hypothetical_protein n=1 Tax=Hexamita inflata TaxID=28002 RepID=A0AA86QK11_9EUKA|nr:Hypothetical protein HINF_LOCUS45131 [Hexamita inflata]
MFKEGTRRQFVAQTPDNPLINLFCPPQYIHKNQISTLQFYTNLQFYTISSTAKSSKCSIHELSKYCHAEDKLAIRERAEEIILKFVHAPQNTPALIDEFLGRFTRPQSYLMASKRRKQRRQNKSRTEYYIMISLQQKGFLQTIICASQKLFMRGNASL